MFKNKEVNLMDIRMSNLGYFEFFKKELFLESKSKLSNFFFLQVVFFLKIVLKVYNIEIECGLQNK